MAVTLASLANTDLLTGVGGTDISGSLTGSNYTSTRLLVIGSCYTGNGGVAAAITPTGGTGVSTSKLFDGPGATTNAIGLFVFQVDYTTPPTSLSISFGGSNTYGTARVIDVSGYNTTTFIDVISATQTTANSTTPTATSLPDVTDSGGLVIGFMTYSTTSLTITPTSPFTQYSEDDEANTSTQALSIITHSPGATGADDPVWSLSSADDWFAAGMVIKPAVGGGGGGGSTIIVNQIF